MPSYPSVQETTRSGLVVSPDEHPQTTSSQEVSTLDRLVPVVYRDLQEVARYTLRQGRGALTLWTTELVHDAYLTLRRQRKPWAGREHVLGVATGIMRQILVDRVRAKYSLKRGGGLQQIDLDEADLASAPEDRRFLVLAEALDRLRRVDPRKVELIELRYVGGFSLREAAQALGLTLSAARRSWTVAKLWLLRELEREPPG